MTAVFIAANWLRLNKLVNMNCKKCGKKDLSGDELAIYRKLVNRGATEFLCIDCLAEYFNCDRKEIEDRIKYYRESGSCTLFV